MNLSEQIKTLHEEIDSFFDKEEYDKAIEIIDKIITNQIKIQDEFVNYAKINFVSLYIEIADAMARKQQKLDESDKLIQKTFGIYNQLGSSVPEMSFFIKCNRARGLQVRYDILYIAEQLKTENTTFTFDEIDSIYLIKDTLSESIRLYWEALKECDDENERYNIRNNLANGLSRAGRSLEALSLLKMNVTSFPVRWQSHISWVHALGNLVESALIPETASLHFVGIESYKNALKVQPPEAVKTDIERSIALHVSRLESFDQSVSEEILALNKMEEAEDIQKHSEYRKFVLFNDLSLSEHSLYCKCRDAGIDNLKIGTLGGSVHVGKQESLHILDGLVNRLMSEFSFARLQYFHYVSGVSLTANDVEFSSVSNNDLTGYHIEQLRTSYRIAYGILDKIKNGIAILLETDVAKSKSTYFEDYFDHCKQELQAHKNRHLTSLYSLAVDLNRQHGSFKHFKEFRNEMEHGFLAINESSQIGLIRMSQEEIKQLTLDLLKLTRSAIFSFVFLVRTTTISTEA
ncbi:MAG: hypothetical protein RL204_668 [Bacteroidota bacterium]|jgi:tetratricopeptide (TPR) repeat protein